MEKEVIVPNHDFNISDYNFFVIVADVGGTHSYIAVMGVKGKKKFDIIFKHTHMTNEIDSLCKFLNQALFEAKELYGIEVNRCCIGAAGPVTRHRLHIKLSHANMDIVAKDILSSTMLNKVILVNDFEAIGYGIDLINKDIDVTKIPVVSEKHLKGWIPGSTHAIIGAGHGLGVSILHYDFNKHVHVPLPSEGGHIDFSAECKEECEMLEYIKNNCLENKDLHPEYEHLLSGKGMSNIYNYYRNMGDGNRSDLIKEIDSSDGIKQLQLIEENYDNDLTCKKVVDAMIKFYARFARNIALVSECYSGLYISGRVAQKNIRHFLSKEFMDEFLKSKKKEDVLMKIPIYIITNNDIGLYGCCNVASNFYNLM